MQNYFVWYINKDGAYTYECVKANGNEHAKTVFKKKRKEQPIRVHVAEFNNAAA